MNPPPARDCETSPEAYVALGSNLGDSERLLVEAMDRLETFSRLPVRRSSLWRTTPVDCPPGSPLFVNAVAGLFLLPGESPEHLLTQLRELEIQFGRRPKQVLNEPRPLDLDLICFGEERRQTPSLTLPHPRAHQRGFVLWPLSEIAPGLILPGQSESVAALLRGLASKETVVRLGGGEASR